MTVADGRTGARADGASAPDFPALWDEALTYEAFLATAKEHVALWQTLRKTATLPDDVPLALPPGAERRLLVLNADWCSDAASTIPVLAALVDRVPGWSLRLLDRDSHPAVMDRYLTNGARAIPIVIVLDEAWRELGHWGPRPSVLQAWVRANRLVLDKATFQREKRTWYARDRGATTVREVAGVGR
ncbi:MAG: thioredoxin family protein [Gemmatimonadales bacterium]|nr:thioredoxin family protein [Gemmatimonadales bacterium]